MPIWPNNTSGYAEKVKIHCDEAEKIMKMIDEDTYNYHSEFYSSFSQCRAMLIECFYSLRYEVTLLPEEKYKTLIDRANKTLEETRLFIDSIKPKK